jgi:hypothetical protein
MSSLLLVIVSYSYHRLRTLNIFHFVRNSKFVILSKAKDLGSI